MLRLKMLVVFIFMVGVLLFSSISAYSADVVVVKSSCSICPTTKTVIVNYGPPQCILDKTCVYLQHADQCVLNCGLPDCGGCCGNTASQVIVIK